MVTLILASMSWACYYPQQCNMKRIMTGDTYSILFLGFFSEGKLHIRLWHAMFSLLFSVSTLTVSISSLSCLHSAPHPISLLKQPPHWSPCQQFLNLCPTILSIHSSHCIRVIFQEKKTKPPKTKFDHLLPRHPAVNLYFLLFCAYALLFPDSVPGSHLSPLSANSSSFLKTWLKNHLPCEALPDSPRLNNACLLDSLRFIS